MSERLASTTVLLLGTLAGVFFVAYIIWLSVSGLRGNDYFFPVGTSTGIAYLVFLALVAVLVGRTGLLARNQNKPTPMTPEGNN